MIGFLSLDSKITVNSDCSHEIQTLAPWKESRDNPGWCIRKQRRHFASKGLYSQSYSFFCSRVQMWELDHKEVWMPKNWCFWTVVLEKTLESPSDYREIKPVIPKGNQPEYSLKRLILKLKLQNFGHLMRRADLLEKTLMLGKIEGKTRREQQRMRWLDVITDLMDMNLSKLWNLVEDRGAWGATVHGDAKSQTWRSNRIITTRTEGNID